MRASYSRRVRIEEKKNIKKAYLYIVLSISFAILLFFVGLPALIKFAGFFTNLGSSNKPVEIFDKTPPAPPQFDSFSEYTNKNSFILEGRSEESAVIKLKINNKEKETVADNQGKFVFNIALERGKNSFYATSTDSSGNLSRETAIYEVVFDNEKPQISLESPSDGQNFYTNSEKHIEIKGSVSTDSELYINDRFTSLSENGNFVSPVSLNEGRNDFNLKASDKAGNEATLSFSVNFTP